MTNVTKNTITGIRQNSSNQTNFGACKYSIVIPVYNVEPYLGACIDSVLEQNTKTLYEVILVDDGSSDRSGMICDTYASRHENIRVVHVENQGVSHARNLGMQIAVGEYVLFLDSDDFWENNFLQIMDTIVKNKPDLAVVGCARVFEDGRRAVEHVPFHAKGESGKEILAQLFEVNKTPLFYSVTYAYSRQFLCENELFFPEYLKVSEDFVQIMRAISMASKIFSCDQPVYNYRMRGDSATASITTKKLIDNLSTKADFFRKYPNAAMANIYANNALLVVQLSKEELPQVLVFLKSNRDIWRYVSERPLKVGSILVHCFGDYCGVVIYSWIRKIVRMLKKN